MLQNDRGVFILSVFRSILDKLISLDKYDKIEENRSDSNIGAWKKQNIRNHLGNIHILRNQFYGFLDPSLPSCQQP